MASLESFSLLFILISSWVFLSLSQDLSLGENLGNGGSDSMPCVHKLMPCQAYLKSSSSAPPASCCEPLEGIIEDDAKCLCAVFNNPTILQSLNVTQDDALNLAKTCGSKADLSICKADSNPTTLPASATPSTPSSSNSSEGNSTVANAPKSSKAATVTLQVGRSFTMAASMFLLTALLSIC